MRKIVQRLLEVKLPSSKSAFLWGPRGSGKSYWVKQTFLRPEDKLIDLLQSDVFFEYTARPALLRERFDGTRVIIDEIQKVPVLLDEVHWLIENKGASFFLLGSSARKLRKSHANLLGGRARRYELGPLSFLEVEGFDLESVMSTGLLPNHYLSEDPNQDLRSYVADYLKEEIAAEAVTRNLPAFTEFLRVSALSNAEILNMENIARECGISARVVRSYFEVLEDTLLGYRLSAWTKISKRRTIHADKFYYFDVGVSNFLARRKPMKGSAEFGKSFEHFIWMELLNYKKYRVPELEIRYYRTASGQEVDFILDDMHTAIEVKSGRVHDGDLKALRALSQEYAVKHKLVVCLEAESRVLDGIHVLPWKIFLEGLYEGKWLTVY